MTARGRYHGQTAAILQPTTTQEVADAVKLATQLAIALVPQGGNTSMVGGATPPADGSALILSLRRMNRIRTIDPQDNLALCEAGVILSVLHDAAEDVGRRFPLSLGAKGSATIGGLVSTNAGGTQVLRHGTMRALVEGVEAVLPDGSIFEGLDALKKDNPRLRHQAVADRRGGDAGHRDGSGAPARPCDRSAGGRMGGRSHARRCPGSAAPVRDDIGRQRRGFRGAGG